MTDRVRINLEVSPTVHQRIERLLVLTDAGSRTEVIRRALAVYEHAVNRARSPVLDDPPPSPHEEAQIPDQLLLEM